VGAGAEEEAELAAALIPEDTDVEEAAEEGEEEEAGAEEAEDERVEVDIELLLERGVLEVVAAAAADEAGAAEEALPAAPPETLEAQLVELPAWMGIWAE